MVLGQVDSEMRTSVLGIGELLWDLLPAGPRLGGAPFNVVAHARRLGFETALLSAVGDDDFGRDALTEMRTLEVRTDLVQRAAGAPTGTVSVNLDGGGHPTYEIHSPAAYEMVVGDPHTLETVADLAPAAVVFGTLAQRFAPVRAATRAILAAHPGAIRVYDANLRDGCWTGPLIEELLSEATVFKLNESEVRVLADVLNLPSDGMAAFGRAIGQRYGLDVVCITEGASGATSWTPNRIVSVPGIPVDVVDTIGAGDAFTAGFVGGLLHGRQLDQALRVANALGALVASRAGAIPSWDLSELVTLEAGSAGGRR